MYLMLNYLTRFEITQMKHLDTGFEELDFWLGQHGHQTWLRVISGYEEWWNNARMLQDY